MEIVFLQLELFGFYQQQTEWLLVLLESMLFDYLVHTGVYFHVWFSHLHHDGQTVPILFLMVYLFDLVVSF